LSYGAIKESIREVSEIKDNKSMKGKVNDEGIKVLKTLGIKE
jgi:hypothetical protein